MRAFLLLLCGVAAGLRARPVIDAVVAEWRELEVFIDRELERLGVVDPQRGGSHE